LPAQPRAETTDAPASVLLSGALARGRRRSGRLAGVFPGPSWRSCRAGAL